jgi:hypothetical protein
MRTDQTEEQSRAGNNSPFKYFNGTVDPTSKSDLVCVLIAVALVKGQPRRTEAQRRKLSDIISLSKPPLIG